jgi:hypothetical protein
MWDSNWQIFCIPHLLGERWEDGDRLHDPLIDLKKAVRRKVKENVQMSLRSTEHYDMKAYEGVVYIYIYIYICTFSWPRHYWRFVVSFTPRPLYSQGNSLWDSLGRRRVGPRTVLDGVKNRKFLTLAETRTQPLCNPARSQSLHRMRYPSSRVKRELYHNIRWVWGTHERS